MGFFSVLHREDEDGEFEVKDCHLNFWVLGGLPWRNNFFFDVGLRIKSNTDSLEGIRLALPFYTDNEDIIDLEDRLGYEKVRWLIFGQRVDDIDRNEDPDHDIMDYPDPDCGRVNVIGINESESHTQEKTKDFTVWDISFRNRLSSEDNLDGQGYLRVRFHTTDLCSVWNWKRLGTLFFQNGARFECRISDARDAFNVHYKPYYKCVKEIDNIYSFLITHSSLSPDIISPAPHYTRRYEGKSWEKYLGVKPYILSTDEKMTIYQWRNETESKTCPDNPFRIFADFSRDRGYVPLKNYLFTGLIVALLSLLYVWLSGADVGLPVSKIVKVVTILSGFLVVIGCFLSIPPHKLYGGLKTVLRGLEKKLLRPRSGLE